MFITKKRHERLLEAVHAEHRRIREREKMILKNKITLANLQNNIYKEVIKDLGCTCVELEKEKTKKTPAKKKKKPVKKKTTSKKKAKK